MKWFKIGILSLLTLFILAALLVETTQGRRLIAAGLLKSLHKSGIEIELAEISGNFPQEISATNVKIDGYVTIESLHIEFSLLALLGGELRITELLAENVQIHEFDRTSSGEGSFPLAIKINHFNFTHVQGKDFPELAVEGSASMRRRAKSAYIDGKLSRYDIPEAYLEFEIAQNRLGKIEGDFELYSPTLSVIKPWIEEDVGDGMIKIHAHTRGTPNVFVATIDGKFVEKSSAPIYSTPQISENLCDPESTLAQTPLPSRTWSFKTRARKDLDKPIQFQKAVISTKGLRISGSVALNESNGFDKANLRLRSTLENLDLTLQAEGTIYANAILSSTSEGIASQAYWKSHTIKINEVIVTEAQGSIEGVLNKQSFLGQLEASANYLQMPWIVSSHLVARVSPEVSISLENLQVESAPLSLHGNLTHVEDLFVGNIALHRANLSLFRENLSGIAQGSILLLAANGEQQVETDIIARNLIYGPVSATLAHVTTEGRDIRAEIEHLKWEKIVLERTEFVSSGDIFSLDTTGKLLHMYIHGRGLLDGYITIEEAAGRFLQHGIKISEPIKLTWNQSQFSSEPFSLSYGPGRIDGQFKKEKDALDVTLKMQQIPLNILSLNPMESRVEGTFNAHANLHKEGEKTDADWKWTLPKGVLENQKEILIYDDFPPEPLIISGMFEGSLHNDKLEFKTNLEVREKPFLSLNLLTPFHLDSNWRPSFPPGLPSGNIKAQGSLEDLFDFLDLGMHRISGQMYCDLSLAKGIVKGSCKINEAYYQNYVTGTELKNLEAHLEGSGDALVLKSLSARDLQENDVLVAKGLVHLSLKEKFPFHIDAQFDHLNVVQIDLVTATAEGIISVDGDLESALVTGSVQVTRSDVSIPTHIPRSYPDLQVIYKHRPVTPVVQTQSKQPYPLQLDLKIDAPKAVFISGRGLTSEWNGDFIIGGTFAEPDIYGSLVLIDGEFSFAGKRFKLSNGSLSMQGNQYKLPLIDISANTTEKAVSITARIKGPVNRPQLTFQSLPPLPLSAILSHLLFGKDLSDVTGLQALQLAGTVASVAGEGPDILEITRKSLGVDRLQIVMTPTRSSDGYEGKETISLEVGKVITPGIILTVKQSANDSNPDIGIEVDLTHGFVLEVESQQQPEQGKFSLKWNVNY